MHRKPLHIQSFALRSLIIGLIGAVFLAGCIPITTGFRLQREKIAQRLASPARLLPRTIAASPFILTTYERMHSRHAPANVYIEGDGKAWLSKKRVSGDPTPTNPVALHLAAYDNAKNVAWIARPCQYTKTTTPDKVCDSAYWTNKRFAPEVIKSYHTALDNIAARYDIIKFNLIGFSGGANVAAILAAERDDVVSLRTVAGNLDHVAHSHYHQVSILEGSLNAVDYVNDLKHVPQHHFIGGQDNIVPSAVVQSYLQAIGDSECVQYSFIQTAEHESGWVEAWPDLLKIPMSCNAPSLAPAPTW